MVEVRLSGRNMADFEADGFVIVEDVLTSTEVAAARAAVIDHGRTWHGSRDNRGKTPRRSVISHCISSAARFHETTVGPIYGRYKMAGTTAMDESFFPVPWRDDGYR